MPPSCQKARELVELASIVAFHGETLLRSLPTVSSSGLELYWTSSKARFERWSHGFKRHEVENGAVGQAAPIRQYRHVRGLVEEVLTSEVLTRIWTAIGCGWDRQNGVQEVGPVVQSVYLGHLEARQRALCLLSQRRGLDERQAKALNQVRRRAERWTDILLAYLVPCCRVRDLAFEMERTEDFAQLFAGSRFLAPHPVSTTLLLASLRLSFQHTFSTRCPNSELNQRISESILSCFTADVFDATGKFQAVWQTRLTHITEDTVGWLEFLAADEGRWFRR